ncbi:MAG: UPF0175 family protein [Conexivisphaerales archaeon]
MKTRKYWFTEDDLLAPIDWDYFKSLPNRVKLALELYMEGRISIERTAEIAELSFREFDELRARARIPIRGPND